MIDPKHPLAFSSLAAPPRPSDPPPPSNLDPVPTERPADTLARQERPQASVSPAQALAVQRAVNASAPGEPRASAPPARWRSCWLCKGFGDSEVTGRQCPRCVGSGEEPGTSIPTAVRAAEPPSVREAPAQANGRAGGAPTVERLIDAPWEEIEHAPQAPVVGLKKDDGKPRWDLLPFAALLSVVDVLTFGAEKYAPGNWSKVEGWRWRYFRAALGHLVAWHRGEKLDAESGLSHLAHACASILFLLELDGDQK